MGKLHIDELQPGMVLAAEVTGLQGRRLFPAGVELGTEQIQILKAWGVTEADVVGATRQQTLSAGSASEESLERAASFMNETFQGREQSNAVLLELYRLCVQRTAERMDKGEFSPISAARLESLKEGAKNIEAEAGTISAEELVSEQLALLSFPSVYSQIQKELQSPSSSARRLGEIVSMDAVLAAKVLRLVNSPFYGFPSSIDSIERAITILGANELTTLALGISAVSCFEGMPSDILNMQHFWEHTISCGVLARLLAGQKPGLSEERFFVAGIVHDIGVLVMVRHMPHAVCRAYYLSAEGKVPLHVAEQKVFGFTHSDVGACLLKEWGIPESLWQLVSYHHVPGDAPQLLEPALLHMADMISLALRNEDYGAFHMPEIGANVLEAVGLAPSELEPLLLQYDRQVHDVMSVFLGDA